MKSRLALPRRGAANHTTFEGTPSESAPVVRLRNARVYTPLNDRPQVGTRHGWKRLFGRRLKDGEGQACIRVGRSSVINGYVVPPATPTYDPCRPMTSGTSDEAGALAGNAWMLDSVPSMAVDVFLDVSPTGPWADSGPATNGVNACAVSPDGTLVALATNYTDASLIGVARVVVYNRAGGIVWTRKFSQTGVARFINSICFSASFLIVCTNQYAQIFRASDGTQLGSPNMNGWAQEAIAAKVATVGGVEYLYIAFDGSEAAATLPNGPSVTAGKYARHFRAGVMKYRLLTEAAGVLTQEIIGNGLASSATYYEAAHGYLRLSEVSSGAPRGGLVTSLAVADDGSFYLGTTNQGWGPNSSFAPDGSVPYNTVRRFTAAGILEWERDTYSIREVGDGGYQNDIPFGGDPTPDPSILALACDSEGVYAAGRQTAIGWSVFALRSSDGSDLWRTNLVGASGAIREGCASIDPTDGNPVFGGDRNTSWAGSGGANAHLWKLNRFTGDVVWSYDIAVAVSALGVAVLGDGALVYGTDKV